MIKKIKNIIYNFLLELKKDHIFLFFSLICSFLLAIIPCLYCFITFYHWYCKIYGLNFLIPFLVISLFIILAKFIHKKCSILVNIIMFIINIFIIFIVQIIIGYFFFLICCSQNINSIGCELKYYTKILQYFPEDKISHFPKELSDNMKNAQLYSVIANFFGSQELVLKFDTDKQFIQSELNKYKFKSKENTNHYAFSTMGGRNLKIDDFTLYVIDGSLGRWSKNYGIGVNKSYNQILYYYTNFD